MTWIIPADEASHGMVSTSKIVDIPAIEELFQKQLSIFTNAIEASDSFAETQFTRKWRAVLSEESDESWTDVGFVKEKDDDRFLILYGDHN